MGGAGKIEELVLKIPLTRQNMRETRWGYENINSKV